MTWMLYADTWYLLFITWICPVSAPLCQFNWLFYMFPDHSKCNKIWFEDASASGGTISHSHTALEHSRVRLLASSRGSSPSSSPSPSPWPWPWPPCRRGQWGGRRWGPRPPPAGDTPTQGRGQWTVTPPSQLTTQLTRVTSCRSSLRTSAILSMWHVTTDTWHVTRYTWHVATAPEAAACVGDVAGMVPGAAPRARALAAGVGHLRSDYLDIYLVSRYLSSV